MVHPIYPVAVGLTSEALYGWLAVVVVVSAAGVISSYFVARHITRRVQAQIDSLLHRQAEQQDLLDAQQSLVWDLQVQQAQAQEALQESVHWRELVGLYREANPKKGTKG